MASSIHTGRLNKIYYAKNTKIIGDPENKAEYAEANGRCEICQGTYLLAIHHRIKQNTQYRGNRYTIELPNNYATLCRSCHGVVHGSRSQYNREGLDVYSGKSYESWHRFIDEQDADEFIANWLKEQHS